MDCNENMDTSLDDIFNFNVHIQGGNKQKRSSILKQTKKLNMDICENDETESCRSRLSTKRVSFAERFQVKELNTGHIYDIPGFNESSQRSQASIQLSYESETNKFVGSFPSRSFVPDASVAFHEPTSSTMNRNPNTQNNKPQVDDTMGRSEFTFQPSPEKSNLEGPDPYFTSKTVMALLEGKPVQYGDENASVYSEPYATKGDSMINSRAPWLDEDFLEASLFKSGSQEYGNKENISKSRLGVSSESIRSGKSYQTSEVDSSNKENYYQTSPRFKNLKNIDSPPSSWKNVLKQQNNNLPLKKSLASNPIGGIVYTSKSKVVKSKDNVLAQNQIRAMGLPSETDKENAYYDKENASTVQKAIHRPPGSKFVSNVQLFSPIQEDNNKTRYSVSNMDLTFMHEDEDVSLSPELEDGSLLNKDAMGKSGFGKEAIHAKTRLSTMDLTCLPEDLDVTSSPELVSEKVQNKTRLSTMDLTCLPENVDVTSSSKLVSEKTQNKTRLSTMDLTCLPEDVDVTSSSKLVSKKTQNKTRLSTMDLTCMPEASNQDDCLCSPDIPNNLDLSLEIGKVTVDKNAMKKSICEKTQNKTRFSTCDMEITCAFNSPMTDVSLPVSPKRDDIEEPGPVRKNNLFSFLESEPKSSQQSNFSFEEIEPNLPSSNPVDTQPVGDVDKHVVNSKPKIYCESPRINPSFGSKNCFSNARNTSFEIPKHKNMEPNFNPCHAAPGRKYLKFSGESENASDRLQTPDEELESSFTLKNKENLNTNRKRVMNSINKPTRLPLGFRTDDLEINPQSKISEKCLPEIAGDFRAGVVSSEEPALVNRDISVGDKEIPTNSQTTRMFRSEIMELTCHNLSLEDSNKVPTPVMKQVHILTETKISSPNVVYSSRKYENTRYSTNFMDLTCQPATQDSFNLVGSFQEVGTKTPSFVSDEIELTCNFDNQSQFNTNYSKNSSAFRHIEQLSETIDSSNANCPLNFENSNTTTHKKTQYFTSEAMELTCKTTNFKDDRIFVEDDNNDSSGSNRMLMQSKCLGDKSLTKLDNKTQYFTSQPMDITCKSGNFQDGNLFPATSKSDNSAIEGHRVPPYFHLKEFPGPDSGDQERLNCSTNRNVRARQKMFKVVTDDFPSSKPSPFHERSETAESSIRQDRRGSVAIEPPSNTLKENCSNAEIVSSISEMNSCFRVNTGHEIIQKDPKEIVSEKPCPDADGKSCASVDMRVTQTNHQLRTPGAVYKIRKIRQALSNNLVLFPELSEALKKKQKFNFKHPFSEMKITSPEIKGSRQNRSFNPSSQENSFSCSSREGSRLPSLGQLSSYHKEVAVPASTEVESLCQEAEEITGIKSLCKEVENLNVVVPSPQTHHSQVYPSAASSANVSEVDCSMGSPERLSASVSHTSHSAYSSKFPTIVYDDESLQLLQHSALENTFLEAASKNYTICLDRSDFVLKEKFPVPMDEQPVLLPPSMSFLDSNTNTMEPKYTMSQANFIAQMSPEKSKVDVKSTSIANETTLGELAPNVAELFTVQEDLTVVSDEKKTLSAVEKTPIVLKAVESSSNQDADVVENEMMNTDSPPEVSFQEPSMGISQTFSNKPEVTSSFSYPDARCHHSSQDLVEESLTKSLNEVVLRKRVVEPEDCIKSSAGNMSPSKPDGVCPSEPQSQTDGNIHQELNRSRVPVLQNKLSSFEEQLEKAFSSDGNRLKLKNLSESSATFELTWAVMVYKCVVRIDVERISALESSVHFTPVGVNVGNPAKRNVFEDIQDRGYNYFQYIVTDTLLPFQIFSKELIDKLLEYSRVASNVEALMGDLLKVSMDGTCVIPHELDPFKIKVRTINRNYECIFNMTFCVDLKKYPREKIIPEVEHVLLVDITKEVQIAADNIEPCRHYLHSMVDAAQELAP